MPLGSRRGSTYLIIGMALALLFFGPGAYWSATWLSKWALLMGFGVTGLSVWVASRTSFWHLPLFLFVFGSLLALAAWPQHPYAGALDAVTLLALQKNAFAGLAEFALGVSFVGWLSSRSDWLEAGLGALRIFWALGTLAILCLPLAGPQSPPNNGLWFGNPSMSASLLACLLPLVWVTWRSRWAQGLTWILTWAVVYRTGASVPWGVLGVVTAGVWLARKPRRALWGIPFLGIGLILLGKKLLGNDFWDPNGRLEIWAMAWTWFQAHGSWSVGMGYSSSQILVPLEQVITGHYHGDYFLWLHNDWLQLLIEGGLLGSLCLALSLGRLLRSAWIKPEAWGSLLGFVTLACFNYPLRMPIHCFCLAIICAWIESRSTMKPSKKLG